MQSTVFCIFSTVESMEKVEIYSFIKDLSVYFLCWVPVLETKDEIVTDFREITT